MLIASKVFIILVAILHIYFLVLEMFLWQKAAGRRVFKMTPENAQITAVLAANQGLYNGFLAVGLLTSFCVGEPAVSFAFRVFFLGCVIVAGLYGGFTFSRRILYVQSGPALVALGLLLVSQV